MSKKTIADGVWPTMLTPYTLEGELDFAALEKLIDWYAEQGAAGLFAVCQSSEMFFLSKRERVDLAKACVKFSAGRLPVIASGHVADSATDQLEEARMMADSGVDAVVLITNRFAQKQDSDDVFKRNLEHFLTGMPESVLLGFYECPFPYKRLLNPELMKFALQSGRFAFLKDTSCNMGDIKAKLKVTEGSGFKLFNANAATLLDSLKAGAAGYSGVMANFHTKLYAWLCKHWQTNAEKASALQDFLGTTSLIEGQLYPINAMYALSGEGVPIQLKSRRADVTGFSVGMKAEVEQLMRLSQREIKRLG